MEKFEKLEILTKFEENLIPKIFIPHPLVEPLYCVSTFAADLRPEEYHGGFSIIQTLPGKGAFFLGTTPDKVISKPVMRQIPSFLDQEHYKSYGRNLYHIIKNTNSLQMIRVNQVFVNHNIRITKKKKKKKGCNFHRDKNGIINQIIYEGAIIFGQHQTPTTFFTYFKEVRRLNEDQLSQIGTSLVPMIELIQV